MRIAKLLVSMLALSVMQANTASASDLDIIPAPMEDAYVPVEIGSGWYIRGDVGYNFGGKHNTDTYTNGSVTYDNKFRDALNVGIGAGYRINDLFRVDASLEHIFSSNFESRTLVAPTGPCRGTGALIDLATGTEYLGPYDITNCIEQDKSSYTAWIGMANAYVDLGTYRGFTPFVGAGLGVARINYSEETGSITCVPVDGDLHFEGCSAAGTVAQPAPNTPYTEPGVVSSGKDWRLAYSVSAGVSYDLSKSLKLDTTYKFSSIAGSTGDIPYGSTPGSSMSKDGFGIHQVKMGLRYELW